MSKRHKLFHLNHNRYGDNMFIETVLLALISLIVLFILTKFMGYRQITQLSMYDYIIGITIGSIASEMVVLEDFQDIIRPLTGMIIYALFTVCLSLLSRHSLTLRHFIEGNPLTLYQHDRIQSQALAKAKMDINELLMQLRIAGYFDLTQIDTVILETNGRLSIFPKTKYRPTTLHDMSLSYQKEVPLIALVIHGKLLKDQLSSIHQDEAWLKSQIQVQGYHDYHELILILCDQNNQITCYPQK